MTCQLQLLALDLLVPGAGGRAGLAGEQRSQPILGELGEGFCPEVSEADLDTVLLAKHVAFSSGEFGT